MRRGGIGLLSLCLALASCASVTPPAFTHAGGGEPVVLVHGLWDSAATYHRMAAKLSAAGWAVYAPSLHPNDGSVPLEVSADQLRRFIEENLGMDTRFNLVGFSMGGIIARYYAQRLGGLDRLLHLVLISTPEHGTRAALLESLPGVVELRPGSPLLADLASDETRLARVSLTSIWTPLDLAVEPPTSSRMPFGREIVLPVLWHEWMVSDDRAIEAVMEALQQRP